MHDIIQQVYGDFVTGVLNTASACDDAASLQPLMLRLILTQVQHMPFPLLFSMVSVGGQWKCRYGEKNGKISWKDHVPNETVLQRVGEKWHLINTIRERQAIWIGHVLHSNTVVKDTLEG